MRTDEIYALMLAFHLQNIRKEKNAKTKEKGHTELTRVYPPIGMWGTRKELKVYRFQNIFIFSYLQSSFLGWCRLLMCVFFCSRSSSVVQIYRSFYSIFFGCVRYFWCIAVYCFRRCRRFSHLLFPSSKAFALKLSLHLLTLKRILLCVFMRHNWRLTNINSNMHRSSTTCIH